VPRPGDQHPVGDLGPYCPHPAFCICVCPWAARRDPHHLDPGAGKHRVESLGELPGPVTDQEPKLASTLPQIHQQVPRLLNRPRAVRVPGDAEDMDMAGADLDNEQHIEAAQGDSAVHVEEVARKKGRACVRRNCRQVDLLRRGAGRIRNRFSTRRTVEALTPMPRPSSSPWIRR
jgi:hypothetical protein